MERSASQTTASIKNIRPTWRTPFENRKVLEERMIEYYREVKGESIHVPITLDQFYYHSLKDVQARNNDQVLFRHQKRMAPTALGECDYLLCILRLANYGFT